MGHPKQRRAAAPRSRMKRFPLGLDDHARRELKERARAHGVSMSAYARAAIVGARPGGAPGQPAAAADEWWDHLSPQRRAQIHGWVARGRAEQEHPADQLTIFDAGESHDEHGNG